MLVGIVVGLINVVVGLKGRIRRTTPLRRTCNPRLLGRHLVRCMAASSGYSTRPDPEVILAEVPRAKCISENMKTLLKKFLF